ncbi:MAG: hypothetical protein PHW31_04690, partial [Candidatus Pacebacteria bacterium]|nr:hypothetical protein [Candidatus Paceibacterota bacterium]
NYPGCEKCPYPYDSLVEDGPSCQELYPETAKCPSSSYCPDCPCEKIDQSLEFCIPNESNEDNAGEEGASTTSKKISTYEVTSAQCNAYSLNDDPLTFYCEDSWWLNPNNEGNNPNPIGGERICSLGKEIPVGQTVDNAENWANEIINSTNKIQKDTNQIISSAAKAGKAKDQSNGVEKYCKCDAKFENKKPICKTDCQFNQTDVPIYDEEGEETGESETVCSCAFTSCQGSPCQQTINYLSDVWNSYRQLKSDFAEFYAPIVEEPRSDIIKQLSYSRQSINNCSLVSNIYGTKARLFSCTRVEDELIAPVADRQIKFFGVTIDGCYGGQGNGHLGKVFNLTDNWFCCDEYTETPTQRNQPK